MTHIWLSRSCPILFAWLKSHPVEKHGVYFSFILTLSISWILQLCACNRSCSRLNNAFLSPWKQKKIPTSSSSEPVNAILFGKRKWGEVFKLRKLRWRDYPGFSMWVQHVILRALIRGRQREMWLGKRRKPRDDRSRDRRDVAVTQGMQQLPKVDGGEQGLCPWSGQQEPALDFSPQRLISLIRPPGLWEHVCLLF